MARWSPTVTEQAAPSFVENLANAIAQGQRSYQQAGQQRIAREDHERQIANETDDRTFRRTQAKNAEMRQADEDAMRGIHAAGWTPDGVATGADALAPESIGRGPMPDLAGTLVAPPSNWRPPGAESDLAAPPPGWTPPRDMRAGPNAGDFSGFEAALLEHPDAMQPLAPPAPRSSSGHPGGYDRVSGRFIPVQRLPTQTLPSGRVFDPNVQRGAKLAEVMDRTDAEEQRKQAARKTEVDQRANILRALRSSGRRDLTDALISAGGEDQSIFQGLVKNEPRAYHPQTLAEVLDQKRRESEIDVSAAAQKRNYEAAHPLARPQGQRAMPSSAVEKMVGLDNMTGLAKEVQTVLNDAIKSKTDATGRALGVISTPSWVKNAAGKGGEEGQKVRAILGNLYGTVAKERGGTALSASELRLLESYLPNENEPEGTALRKVNSFIRVLEQMKGNRVKAYGQYGYGASGGINDDEAPVSDRMEQAAGKSVTVNGKTFTLPE